MHVCIVLGSDTAIHLYTCYINEHGRASMKHVRWEGRGPRTCVPLGTVGRGIKQNANYADMHMHVDQCVLY